MVSYDNCTAIQPFGRCVAPVDSQDSQPSYPAHNSSTWLRKSELTEGYVDNSNADGFLEILQAVLYPLCHFRGSRKL